MLNLAIRTSLVLLLLANLALADAICDGVNDTYTSGLDASDFLSTTTGTLALWYKPTGTASSAFGSSDCYPGEHLMGDNVNFGITRNGNLAGNDRLCVWAAAPGLLHVESTYTTNAWTHLVWVHSGGTLYFYKDGGLVSSVGAGDISMDVNLQFCDGTPSGSSWGEGVIGEASVFTTALSVNEIAALAGSHLHRIASSAPSGYWEMGTCGDGASCDTGTFLDRSGNARNLTATGGTGAASEYLTYPWGVE